jgi:GGDEF domain-containing protein
MHIVLPRHDYGTCTTCRAMEREVERLRAELADAHHDPVWGIGTRQAVERRMTELTGQQAAIVLDIDDMHGANSRLGHAEVDRRIAGIMQTLRNGDTYAGRWLRGDEIVVFCDRADADGLAIRLLVLFELYGLGATIAITAATRDGVDGGIFRIGGAKSAGRRGEILGARQ